MTVFLLLTGKGTEYMAVLRIVLPGLILGEAPHFPPVTAAQNDLRRIVGNCWLRDYGFSSGNQGINAFHTDSVGLLLLSYLPGSGSLGRRELFGKMQIRSGIHKFFLNEI